jgi:hypothetical protein
MSSIQNDAFDIRAPKPIDKRYLKNELIPWTSVVEVNSGINSAYRYQGLTVLISSTEYWYIGGITDDKLVPKKTGDIIVTLSSDGFYEFPTNNLVMAIVVTPDIPLGAFKAGSSNGAEDFIPAMAVPEDITTAIVVAIWRSSGQRIYFGGVSGSNTSIIIKTL